MVDIPIIFPNPIPMYIRVNNLCLLDICFISPKIEPQVMLRLMRNTRSKTA